MAKVLLSKLPQAVSEVIGNIYQGVISARDTGIDWARSPDKVDFQAEIVLNANDIQREQVEESDAVVRITEEDPVVTTQLQGPGRSETISNDTNSSSGTRTSNGTRNSNGSNSSNSNASGANNSTSSENSSTNNGGSKSVVTYDY